MSTSKYEPNNFVAVPKLVRRRNKNMGCWADAARKLSPGTAMQVPTYSAAKMLQRAAINIRIKASIHTNKTDKTIWVGVPDYHEAEKAQYVAREKLRLQELKAKYE